MTWHNTVTRESFDLARASDSPPPPSVGMGLTCTDRASPPDIARPIEAGTTALMDLCMTSWREKSPASISALSTNPGPHVCKVMTRQSARGDGVTVAEFAEGSAGV